MAITTLDDFDRLIHGTRFSARWPFLHFSGVIVHLHSVDAHIVADCDSWTKKNLVGATKRMCQYCTLPANTFTDTIFPLLRVSSNATRQPNSNWNARLLCACSWPYYANIRKYLRASKLKSSTPFRIQFFRIYCRLLYRLQQTIFLLARSVVMAELILYWLHGRNYS